jgi:hypothetical protein
MNWIITLYVALLFFLCVPGVVVNLPPKRGKLTTAACHAVIFALIWHFTHKMVWHASMALYEPPHHEGLVKV